MPANKAAFGFDIESLMAEVAIKFCDRFRRWHPLLRVPFVALLNRVPATRDTDETAAPDYSSDVAEPVRSRAR
jgi:hypothetical protein